MTRKFRAADMFCGAGGSTKGAIDSGHVDVVFAINHWPVAVKSHSANHPGTKHVCSPIEWVDPRRDVPAIDLLLASPECTHHSVARGGRPVEDQKRATGWHVVHWMEALRPRFVVIENVREYQDWGPIGTNGKPLKGQRGETFKAWIAAMRSLGYDIEWRLLNAADYGEATRRIRLFVVCRRGVSKRAIRWPAPTHARVPTDGLKRWRPAYEVIDFSKPCPSIFGRKRPLADKTLQRIEAGIRKFYSKDGNPFIVKLRGTNDAASLNDPTPTVTGGGTHLAMAQPIPAGPFIVPHFGEREGQVPRTHSISEPLPTVTGQGAGSLVVPFVVGVGGSSYSAKPKSVNEPLNTVLCQDRRGLVTPFLVDVNHGESGRSPGGRLHSVEDPVPTITATHGRGFVQAFVTPFYGTGKAHDVRDPLSTITAKHRHGLTLIRLMEELGIMDIGFRMLGVDELAEAQGFGREYQLEGSQADQVRQIGNAVPPKLMRALCTACAIDAGYCTETSAA